MFYAVCTQERATAQAALTTALQTLEQHLAAGHPAHVAGGSISIADVALAAALQPLFACVLGAEARTPFPATLQWLQALAKDADVAKALGGCWPCLPFGCLRAASLVSSSAEGQPLHMGHAALCNTVTKREDEYSHPVQHVWQAYSDLVKCTVG